MDKHLRYHMDRQALDTFAPISRYLALLLPIVHIVVYCSVNIISGYCRPLCINSGYGYINIHKHMGDPDTIWRHWVGKS